MASRCSPGCRSQPATPRPRSRSPHVPWLLPRAAPIRRRRVTHESSSAREAVAAAEGAVRDPEHAANREELGSPARRGNRTGRPSRWRTPAKRLAQAKANLERAEKANTNSRSCQRSAAEERRRGAEQALVEARRHAESAARELKYREELEFLSASFRVVRGLEVVVCVTPNAAPRSGSRAARAALAAGTRAATPPSRQSPREDMWMDPSARSQTVPSSAAGCSRRTR